MSKEENEFRKAYRAETGESPNAAAWEPADYTNSYVGWLESQLWEKGAKMVISEEDAKMVISEEDAKERGLREGKEIDPPNYEARNNLI